MGILDEARKWLDWAFGTFSASRYEDAQYNLNQFQAIYLQSYWTVDEATRQELERMNARALTLQSMLQERKTWSQPWYAGFIPGTTVDNIQEAGTAAQEAAKLAQEAAARAGDVRYVHQATSQGIEAKESTRRELADAPNAYRDFLRSDWFGVPVWAWGLGAVALLWMVKK